MKRVELISRIFIIFAVIGAVGAPLFLWTRTPLIRARVAEEGGWIPGVLKAEAGKPVLLRLTSDDVMHGFAVGQMEMAAVDVEPGKVTEISLIFEKPGTYTFYCTRWCGLNHWRMRGSIEVSGSTAAVPPASIPLFVALDLDIDAPHDSPVVPDNLPSAIRGRQLSSLIDISRYRNLDIFRSSSPYQVFVDLDSTNLGDTEKWDVVSYIWQSNTTPEALGAAGQMYAQNCAACHGESGGGDGVFADELAKAGNISAQTMTAAHDMNVQRPVNFTDPGQSLGASPALLHGKILRGGMGTGMPMWGSIFTENQIWDLVAYLYSFQFGDSGAIR